MVLEDFFTPSVFLPVHHISTRPQRFLPVQNYGWMGLCIKLCMIGRGLCTPTTWARSKAVGRGVR